MDDQGSAEAVREPRTLHLPPLPGTRRSWIELVGQLSGLFLSLRDAETSDGADLPCPFRDGRAAASWSRVSRPLVAAYRNDVLTGVRVPLPDVEVLGEAAAVAGLHLLRDRTHGVPDDLTAVLRREARVHGREPERLVVQLARVHGVVSVIRPEPALAVWAAGN